MTAIINIEIMAPIINAYPKKVSEPKALEVAIIKLFVP